MVLAFGVLLIAACGRSSAPAHDAAIPTLDVLLYDGVKNVTAMVAGPDGNLWLATSDGTIARTTMAGETEVFPIGLWQSGYTSLARGPDGYLWLGSSDCSQCSLARVATDGTITEVFAARAGASLPGGNEWHAGASAATATALGGGGCTTKGLYLASGHRTGPSKRPLSLFPCTGRCRTISRPALRPCS